MRYRIQYAPRSRRDLEKIRTYIAKESADTATADRFLVRLFAACDGLDRLPARFAVYPHAPKWRMMPFGNYLIFYQIAEETVRVGHVRHAAQLPFTGAG